MSEAERITRLEERYLHLQRHATEQDKVMLELGDELARLRKELAALREELRAGAEAPPGSPPSDERPPHY